MSALKGYPSQSKRTKESMEFATMQPLGADQNGLETLARTSVYDVASDTAEAASTTDTINATAHVARRGDQIRFTAGANDGVEVYVASTTTDTIILASDLLAAPGLDDFTISRPVMLRASSGGGLSSSLSFTRNGADQIVTEDTATPANNRPLPVKLVGFDGDAVINAANLNLEVQLTHTGANPDSVQVGNGTDTLVFGAGVNAAGVLRTTPATDAPHLLATRHETLTTPLAARLSNGAAAAAYGAGVNAGTVLRTTPATDAPHLLATRHEAAATPLSVRVSNGATFGTDLPVSQQGRVFADSAINDYGSTPSTTAGAYVELVASTAADIETLWLADTSGRVLELATGAVASETRVLVIPQGGLGGPVDLAIPSGTRISVKAISADATSGFLTLTGLR